jgi:hypothetical protein
LRRDRRAGERQAAKHESGDNQGERRSYGHLFEFRSHIFPALGHDVSSGRTGTLFIVGQLLTSPP